MSISNSFSNFNAHNLILKYNNLLEMRLRTNESTIHGCLKFAALLAQIDALQNGALVEDSILEALKKALGNCKRILEIRLGSKLVPTIPPGTMNADLDEIIDGSVETPNWLALASEAPVST